MDLAQKICDRNVINTVLHKIYIKEGAKNFITYVSKYPKTKSAVVDFLNECNPGYIEKYLIKMENHEEKLYYYLEKYFLMNDLKQRKDCLNKAKECIKLIDSSKYPKFESKFYKSYIESLENNIKFKMSQENRNSILEISEDVSFDISIYDLYKIIILGIKDDKTAAFEKYNGKNFGFPQEGMNILKMILLCENNRFAEMDLLLKKYNNLKKLSLTSLNVGEIYYKFNKYEKAVDYLKNVIEPIYLDYKVNMFVYIENYEAALEVVFSDKKITNLGVIVSMILSKRPNLKPKVDELCEKNKIKLEFE